MIKKFAEQRGENVILHLLIKANSQHNAIIHEKENELKIQLRAVREKGQANKKLIEFLAEFLHLAKSDITIISGEFSPHKKILLHNCRVEDILDVIGLP